MSLGILAVRHVKAIGILAVVLALWCTPTLGAADGSWPLSLSQAQHIAHERNHDLQIARTVISSARAGVEMAAAAPNPSLTVSTSSISTATRGAGGLWKRPIDTVLHIDQLIERGGKRELRREGAEQQVRAVRSDYSDIVRQLRASVAQAYTDLKLAQDKRAAALDHLRLLEAMLSAAQIRKSAGDIAGADVERVRVDQLRAQNDVTLAEGELMLARRLLARVLGISEEGEQLEASDAWPEPHPPQPLSGTPLEEVISRRPDVRAAIARIGVADAGSRLAHALRTRDVTVGMQYEHFPQPGDPNGGSGNSLGLSVQVPLFTRYYFQGEILAAEASRTASQQALLRARALAENEISTAWSGLAFAAERVRRNRDELLPAAEKAANAAEYAYRYGAVGVMDVLDARRTLRITRLDALAAQAELSKAWFAWTAATNATTDATTDAVTELSDSSQ